ncbi:zinc-dependent alcohol dehydrogenase family protein [Methylomonas rhizoryzae]|uniref:zinc-dependent alcohol dehydrogenase family protein n=1 Tax=Methylomonas rhizoryzae TaxID=2608981 RepID=UPI0012324344|nr:zinc-dependent alcohol dehydrogenase family protein [Methylomonas rhizoryzae]
MRAMLLTRLCRLADTPEPLAAMDWPQPSPGPGEVLLKISVCGICHTELDEIEGRTPPPHLPVIPGHQVVGRVAELGANARAVREGDRVGVAWIFSACGRCRYCLAGNENLCAEFVATGRDANGGYAEYMTVPAEFCHPIPAGISDLHAAPLLCAGAIGYRSLRLSGIANGQRLGLTGFGASGHQVLSMARHLYPDSEIYVFARSAEERRFALELGAVWAGDTREPAPHRLDSIIDTTPVWTPVVEALANLAAGGRLVINAIRKEGNAGAWLQLDYAKHLWQEKEIKSVANITRRDVQEFLQLAADIPLRPTLQTYPLQDANPALQALKKGDLRGAKVLQIA